MYRTIYKPLLDYIGALIILIILSPIIVLITLVLAISNNGKPFFYQKRPGKNEKLFYIIKFKSMTEAKDSQGNLLPDKERLTKVGAFVRKTSLDELPQLINVLKGEMSFIGPRSLLTQYLPYYTSREKLRHKVRPGITGLAQVNGRNNLNWDERLEMDVVYVENLSFQSDIKIIVQTLKNVINRKDIVVIPSEYYTTLDKYRSNENYTS